MKRFILSLLITAIGFGAYAQKGKVSGALNYINSGNLPKAKEAIDAAIVHEKTVNWPKTYYAKGRLAQALYESGDDKLIALYPDPLSLAYECYKKAIELDDKNAMEKLIMIQMPALSNDFQNLAALEFEAKNYEKSLVAFEQLIVIQEGDLYIGMLDTALVYNAGVVAFNGKLYDKSIEYFDRSIELGYGGTQAHLFKYQAYIDTEDLENAETTLIAAFNKYPENKDLMMNLVDFYYMNEMDDEAFAYVAQAKEKDPTNHSLYWVEGNIYMKQEKYEEAATAFRKSIELNPEIFDTQYNMGVCYYNQGSDMSAVANDIMDNRKYNEAVEEIKDIFQKAVPYMEKALELRPDDVETMTSLRELYYRLKTRNESYEAKFEEMKAKIEEIEG